MDSPFALKHHEGGTGRAPRFVFGVRDLAPQHVGASEDFLRRRAPNGDRDVTGRQQGYGNSCGGCRGQSTTNIRKIPPRPSLDPPALLFMWTPSQPRLLLSTGFASVVRAPRRCNRAWSGAYLVNSSRKGGTGGSEGGEGTVCRSAREQCWSLRERWSSRKVAGPAEGGLKHTIVLTALFGTTVPADGPCCASYKIGRGMCDWDLWWRIAPQPGGIPRTLQGC